MASVPVTRFVVRSPQVDAAMTIRLVGDDPQSVVIRFFDTNGADITEAGQRKIERLFLREDFRRVFPGEIDASERYLRRMGRPRAERLLARLRQADGDMKGGSRIGERLQLERLILELSGRA